MGTSDVRREGRLIGSKGFGVDAGLSNCLSHGIVQHNMYPGICHRAILRDGRFLQKQCDLLSHLTRKDQTSALRGWGMPCMNPIKMTASLYSQPCNTKEYCLQQTHCAIIRLLE